MLDSDQHCLFSFLWLKFLAIPLPKPVRLFILDTNGRR